MLITEKQFYLQKLKKTCDIPLQYITDDCTRIDYPDIVSAHYSKDLSKIEFFSRLVYGFIPLVKNGYSDYAEIFNTGIINGCNPDLVSYWGEMKNHNQQEVEMVPLIFMLILNKEKTWNTYNIQSKKNIIKYFSQVNKLKYLDSNWLFFRLIVNLFLKEIGAEYEQKAIDICIKKLNDDYIECGWYSDGKGKFIDYYSAFAYQYYSIMIKICFPTFYMNTTISSRADEFYNEYIYWFSKKGDAIPYGRSLLYREAQVSFWAVLILSRPEKADISLIKGILMRNLDWWDQQKVSDTQGILTIGYSYSNLITSEDYNSSGSPYWCLKSYIFLCLEDDDIFWKMKIKELPKLDKYHMFANDYVICRNKMNNHTILFPNHSSISKYGAHKYLKFAYSNLFGFSVSRTCHSFEGGGFDNTLVVKKGDLYISRNQINSSIIKAGCLISDWSPLSQVKITSYIIPGNPWHVRIHKLKCEETIEVFDTGYAIESPCLSKSDFLENSIFISSCKSINSKGIVDSMEGLPNTNVLFPKASIPYVYYKLKKGEYFLFDTFFGGYREEYTEKNNFSLVIINNKVKVTLYDNTFEIDMDHKYKSKKTSVKQLIKQYCYICYKKMKV